MMQTPAVFQPPMGCSNMGQVAELQRELAEAHSTRFGLDRQLSMLCRQMSEGSTPGSTKSVTFEDALNTHWETQEATMASSEEEDEEATYKLKYMRLKARMNRTAQEHLDEVDSLHEEVALLQERIQKLDAARCRAQSNEATLAETLQATTSQVSTELADLCCENHTLYCENQALMQELVGAKVELAQLREREVVWRRELFKAKETNRSLASKMNRLDTLVEEIVAKR